MPRLSAPRIENTVDWPVPRSAPVPETVAVPSACSRILIVACPRDAEKLAVAIPIPTSQSLSVIAPGVGLRRDQPNRSAPTV